MSKERTKTVIVTGAGQGIGRGIASAFAANGWHTALIDKEQEPLLEVTEELRSQKYKAEAFIADVSKPEDIISVMEKIHRKFTIIDCLVNNAGVSEWKSPYELTVEDWDRILHTNLRSVFLCSREAARFMRKKGGGSIINMASTRAFMSEPNSEAYAASKGGIVALTHALAASFTNDKIIVNSISPGWIETGKYEDLRQIDHEQHLSKRVGTPEDIAKACLYLADTENNFVNGTNLVIDGGMTRKMIYEH